MIDVLILVIVCIIILSFCGKIPTHETVQKILYSDEIKIEENVKEESPSEDSKEKVNRLDDVESSEIPEDIKIDSQDLIKEILGDG